MFLSFKTSDWMLKKQEKTVAAFSFWAQHCLLLYSSLISKTIKSLSGTYWELGSSNNTAAESFAFIQK